MMTAMAGGAGAKITLNNASYTAVATNCGLEIGSDGNLYAKQSASYTLQYAWLTGGAGAAYECRVTVVSGTLSSGTANTWLACSADNFWTRNSPGSGSQTVSLTVEIRLAASGTVVATATINLTGDSGV